MDTATDSMSSNPDESGTYQASLTDDPSFDIVDWHPAYLSCQRFFVDHAQYEPGTQALCALINIRLPYQWLGNAVTASHITSPIMSPNHTISTFPRVSSAVNSPGRPTSSHQSLPGHVSLIPYLRRLVVTGFDKPAILHGLFGNDYTKGVSPLLDCERRNYLFAAKSGGWTACKRLYDIGSANNGDETVPFLKPLDEAKLEELTAAERAWSSWLAMEDWMVGPRAPADGEEPTGRSRASRRHSNNATNGTTQDFTL